jgi:hypothetical protein
MTTMSPTTRIVPLYKPTMGHRLRVLVRSIMGRPNGI